MKKKYLFISGAKRWNNLLNKFTKLQKRLQLLSTNTSMYNKLVTKLQGIFSKLEKMQYQTGIKVAATSLALILSAFTANAQFAAGVQMRHTGDIYEVGVSKSAFADLDIDGDDDLYVGKNDGKIEVFTNNNGTYTYAGLFQASGADIDVGLRANPVFADIDGDGDLDLYVGRSNGNIVIYTNNNGNFTGAGLLQVSGNALDVGNNAVPTFADIDGDGDLDLYVGESSGKIEVFTNNNGVFTANGVLGLTDPFPLSQAVAGYAAPTFADIDGDGDLDLFVGSISGEIVTFSNTGGSFTATGDLQSNLNVAIDPGIRTRPTFRDADNDGDLDLYINGQSSNIFLYTNIGGVFTAAGKVQANDLPIKVNSSAPTFADIDADGDLDLYIGSGDGTIKVLSNNNGTFTDAGNLQAGTTINVGNYAVPTFADIDGDGNLDLYVGEYDGNINSFSNNNGVFTGGLNVKAGGSTILLSYSAPTFADLDSDGDLDLYVGEYNGEISEFINTNGVFAVATTLQAGGINIDVNYRSKPTFADIDNDGDLDLYMGNGSGSIQVFTNTGGVFSAATILQAGGANINVGDYATPTFADVDGDGDLDLYVGSSDGNITFYENLSSSAILVSSIAIQGAGNLNTITTFGGTLQISATVLPANADDGTYTWSVTNGTGSATIDANGLLTASADGTVTVTATANDASGETATMIVTISNQSTGVNELASQKINIYPNPVKNQLFIELDNQEVTEITIIDYSGRIVKTITNNNAKSIDVSDLTQGIYILKVATENGVLTNRFIKQ